MIETFADRLVFELLGLSSDSALGAAVHFFVYDTIKIVLLLFVISFVMGVVNATFPIDRVRHALTRRRLYGLDYFLAALFGAVTPFCSCSSVPLFIGFVAGGIPLGVTFTFLIASPLISEVAVAMFLGTFGLKVTLLYVVSGTVLSMAAGWILSRMRLHAYLSDWAKAALAQSTRQTKAWDGTDVSLVHRLPDIAREASGVVRGVLPYVLIGIGIGAAMHGYVPEAFFERHLAANRWWSVPLAVLAAAPVYANAAGIVPIVEVFVDKGIALGTAIAFMMAVIGLSLPEALMLKKVMTWRLIGIFFGVVTVLIIVSGWLFNGLL
ncbi:MAG: permease [Duodenibacillus sp.]|nr:permease [Duodenibacillus sp.]